jgi:hypothetical protein
MSKDLKWAMILSGGLNEGVTQRILDQEGMNWPERHSPRNREL